MEFTYKIRNTISNKHISTNNADTEQMLRRFEAAILNDENTDVQIQQSKISYLTRNSLFRIKYQVELDLHIGDSATEINYSINLIEMFKINIAVALTAVFLARMSILDFIYLFFLIFILFYLLNRFFIILNIKKTILRVFDSFDNVTQSIVQEGSYMHDASRCPACGNNILGDEIKCPSCGLHLPRRGKNQRQVRIPTEELNINYEFKEKPKKPEA